MTCTGCKIEFAIANDSDPDVLYLYTKDPDDAHDGQCTESSNGSCYGFEPCVFPGSITVVAPASPAGTPWRLQYSARNMAFPEDRHVEGTSDGGQLVFNLPIRAMNSSLCDGLKDPLDNSKGYRVELLKDFVTVWSGWLYCGLCS